MSLKRFFDRSISGSLWKQLSWLIGIMISVLIFWVLLSYLFFDSSADHQFNKGIESRFWAIFSQMLDSGNLH